MLFEVPVDHFPVQRVTRPERPQRLNLLRIPQISVIQRQEVSAAVELLSPSVRRSQFTFSASRSLETSSSSSNRTTISAIPLQRRNSSVSSLRPQQQKAKQWLVQSRTFQMPDLLQVPFRLLSVMSQPLS